MRWDSYRTRAQINRDFRHQIILPASEYTGDKAKLHKLYCANLNFGADHGSVIINALSYVIYCFANRQDANRFRKNFGGKKLNRHQQSGRMALPIGQERQAIHSANSRTLGGEPEARICPRFL
jgi:hypothetical protein